MAGEALAGATALILAGGLGTRLRAAIGERPKVLADVDGVPFVLHLLRRLSGAGVRRAVLCTGHGADTVRETLGDLAAGVRLCYSEEPEPLGTAGALRHALALVTSRTALVLNGDSLCDLDVAELWRFHHAHAATATIGLATSIDPARFGRVEIDANWRVLRFAEKDAATPPKPVWINAGLYLIAADALAAIPPQRRVSLERETLPALLGGPLFGFPGAQRFLDIGVPEDYAKAARFVAGLREPGGRKAPHRRRGARR